MLQAEKKWEEKRHMSLLIQDMELLRFGAFPARFWSNFDPSISSLCFPPPFWNGYIYILSHQMLEINHLLFDFAEVIIKRFP